MKEKITLKIAPYDGNIFNYYSQVNINTGVKSNMLNHDIIVWFAELGVKSSDYSYYCPITEYSILKKLNGYYCEVTMPKEIASMFILRWNPRLVNLNE
jgi:hypothetical protein